MRSTFAILPSGHPCTELALDVGKARAWMIRAGYAETEPAAAAVLFVASCAFNREYEEDAVARVAEARRLNPRARIIVAGCLAPINPGRFRELGEVDALPPAGMERLREWFPAPGTLDDAPCHAIGLEAYERNAHFMAGIRLKRLFDRLGRFLPVRPPAWLATVPMPDWYYVRAATGCAGACSYCAIRRARGAVRSVAAARVVEECRAGLALGMRDICLAGDDLGCWGSDIGLTLADLLDPLVALPGDWRLHLRFVEPFWLVRHLDRLLPALRSGRVAGFCVPLQSGSQRILAAMRRSYRISDAVAAIHRVLAESRVRSLSSIVMVGFPGETAADFAASYALLERARVPLYQVLRYEGRPDTPSEALPDPVPEELKDLRQRRFRMKMQLVRFAGLPAGLAERIVTRRLGPLR